MDENSIEETPEASSTVGAYAALFATVFATGALAAVGAVVGAEVAVATVDKLKAFQKKRIAKKAD